MVLTISLTKGVSMKRILINSSYNDELRVALVDGAKLFDLDTEVTDRVLYKGSIFKACLLYTSPSPRDQRGSRMPSSA